MSRSTGNRDKQTLEINLYSLMNGSEKLSLAC